MTENPAIRALEDRKVQIKQKSAELQSALDALNRELDEIETTERVLGRLGVQRGKPSAPTQGRVNGAAHGPAAMTDKIIKVVGEGGIARPADVLRAIRERWMPNVEGNDVRPTLWRLVKDGRIIQDEAGYHLP